MIIFDLDGTLADCEHRRHFVDPECLDIAYWKLKTRMGKEGYDAYSLKDGRKWKPDWQAFYEACDKDTPIVPVIQMFTAIERENICPITKTVISPVHIWSGRCESVRGKTEYWINNHVTPFQWNSLKLKMRPIGDSTPDDQLKERWLDEYINSNQYVKEVFSNRKCPIEFVFDSDPKSIAMWRRRGIFVFDCNQTGKEF